MMIDGIASSDERQRDHPRAFVRRAAVVAVVVVIVLGMRIVRVLVRAHGRRAACVVRVRSCAALLSQRGLPWKVMNSRRNE